MELDLLNRKVPKRGLLQYLLIYICIQYIGGRVLAALGSDLFYGGAILLCGAVLLWMGPSPLPGRVWGPMLGLTASLLFTAAITAGGLSLGSVLSLLSRFLAVYAAVRLDPERFPERFLKLTCFLASVSLVLFFFVQAAGQDRALELFSRLYSIPNGKDWLGPSCGLFVVGYNFMDPARNAYLFGEPGEYQSLISAALYFLTFQENGLAEKKKGRYLAVFLLTLLTIQSTVGLVNLAVYCAAALLAKKEQVGPAVKRTALLAAGLGAGYLVFVYKGEGFLYKNLVSKLVSPTGELDLSAGTGAARIEPIRRFLETVRTCPEKLLFGVGFEGLPGTPMGEYTTDGMLNLLVMIGAVSYSILAVILLGSFAKSAAPAPGLCFGLFLMFSMGLSQPDLLPITSVMICMVPAYRDAAPGREERKGGRDETAVFGHCAGV